MSSVPGLILQHEASAPPALLEEWLRTRGLAFTVHHAGQGPLPDLRRFSFVTSLGSESSAVDLDPPWITEEIDALRAAIAGEVPILGICFGGQALSLALGGGTDRAAAPEVGWIAIDSHDGGVPEGPWAQYHNEVMRVPPGARYWPARRSARPRIASVPTSESSSTRRPRPRSSTPGHGPTSICRRPGSPSATWPSRGRVMGRWPASPHSRCSTVGGVSGRAPADRPRSMSAIRPTRTTSSSSFAGSLRAQSSRSPSACEWPARSVRSWVR